MYMNSNGFRGLPKSWGLLARLGVLAVLCAALAMAAPLAIGTSPTLPAASTGVAYSLNLVATGGSPYPGNIYLWSSPSLPPGLSLSNAGLLSGVPTTAGTFAFDVTVTDATSSTATAHMSLTVAAAASLSIVTSATLPQGTVGTSYSQKLSVTGGTGGYLWALPSGSLPPGLTLQFDGTISGTPTAGGTYIFTVAVSDSTLTTVSRQLSLTVIGSSAQPLSITTSSTLPGATAKLSYSTSLGAVGGTPPYTWALVTGALPIGISLSPAGVLSGTPTTAGTANFTLRITDAVSSSVTQSFVLTVAANGGPQSLNRVGVFSHVAAGGGWTTSLYLVNPTATEVSISLNMFDDNGGAAVMPLSVTTTSGVQTQQTSTLTGIIPAGGVLLVKSSSSSATGLTAWGELQASEAITGYASYHYTAPSGAECEASLPLDSAARTSFLLPYDNTNGSVTAIALSNLSGAALAVQATAYPAEGGSSLGTLLQPLSPNGHVAFLLTADDKLSGTKDQRGLVEFSVVSGGGTMSGLGLRVDPRGGVASIPLLARQ